MLSFSNSSYEQISTENYHLAPFPGSDKKNQQWKNSTKTQ